MKTTISGYFASYGPVALAVALIVLAALHAYDHAGAPREPLAADQVTAELARTVSYGLIDASPAGARSGAHHAAPPTAPAATSEAS